MKKMIIYLAAAYLLSGMLPAAARVSPIPERQKTENAAVTADTAGRYGGPAGPWTGKIDTGVFSLNLTFNLPEGENGGRCTLDSPDQGVKGLEATMMEYPGDSVSVSVPDIGAHYVGKITRDDNGTPVRIDGVFTQAGASLPLVLEPGTAVQERPQTPVPPFPYKTEEVTFRNGDVTLSGTLTLPEGYTEKDNGNVPVVLMVTGSGQQNRDEEIFGHKPFAVIADWFAKNGIASLRYDDRGTGASGGDGTSVTVYSNMEDAKAGLEYLESLGIFGKTGVLGHSEGGLIAFMLAGMHKTDFIISLAGPAVSGRQIIVEQNRRIFPMLGIPEAVADDYCTILDKMYEYKLSGNDDVGPDVSRLIMSLEILNGVTLPEDMRKNLESVFSTENPWFDSFIAIDPGKYIKEITCPVFAAIGSLDTQVIAGTNLAVLREMLGKDPRNAIMEYEGLNHLFQHCRTGNPAEYPGITWTFSEEVLSDIVEWTGGHI